MADWFETWFDTPYYHLLYKDRNRREADSFIAQLVASLSLQPQSKVVDLGCGKGRHAIRLNQLGMEVIGLDLSPRNIAYAKQYSSPTLRFEVHDMRQPLVGEQCDVVFNLFTSFGYFTSVAENQKVIAAVASYLKTGGRLLIDFMNVEKVMRQLLPRETKEVEGVTFHIERRVEDGFIRKRITVEEAGEKKTYEERVQAFRYADFEQFLTAAGFAIDHVWGSYALDQFDVHHSDRLVISAVK